MQAQHLALISGLAIAVAGGSALAQTRTGTEQDSRQRMQDRQDRLEDASRGARDRDSRFGSSSNILTSLEGIWNVNVQVNRTNWDLMNGGDRQTQTNPRTNPQTNPRTEPGQPGNDPQQRERDAREREERLNNPQTDRQNDRQTDRRDQRQTELDGTTTTGGQAQMGSADGLARSHAILGGDILRTTLIFGAEAASTRTTPGMEDRQMQERQQRERDGIQDRNPDRDQDQNRDRNPDRPGNLQDEQQRQGLTTTTTTGAAMDNNSLRSVSFLGYNEAADEYNLALMTANGGAIHYFTGKYDQSDRRIIFTSVDSSPTATTTDRRTTTTDRDTQRPTGKAGASTNSLSVVLQMEGTDSYTITAYRGTATSTGTTGAGTELGGQPAQRQDRDNNNPRQGRDADQDRGRTASQTTLAPNVIYKATYTKADNTMRSQYDRIFDEREQAERRTQLRVR